MRKQVVLVVMAVLANGLSAGPLGILPGGVARAATDCLAAPNAQSPPGSHWYYRVDRVNNRRCWYLAPLGGKVRPDASQVASPDLRRTAPPQSQPTATTPVEQQPTLDATVQPLNAVPPAEATFGQGSLGLSPAASDQPQPPGPDGREVAPGRTRGNRTAAHGCGKAGIRAGRPGRRVCACRLCRSRSFQARGRSSVRSTSRARSARPARDVCTREHPGRRPQRRSNALGRHRSRTVFDTRSSPSGQRRSPSARASLGRNAS